MRPPVDWPLAVKKLALCFALGERVEAISTWKKIVADESFSPPGMGVIEAEAKKSALPDFNYLLADLHVRQGRLGPAREELSSLVVARPHVADYRLALGEVYEKQGLRRKARLCYEKALELSPANQEAKKKVLEYYGTWR
jgi:tetratricopeptide (TPR) repeat protein